VFINHHEYQWFAVDNGTGNSCHSQSNSGTKARLKRNTEDVSIIIGMHDIRQLYKLSVINNVFSDRNENQKEISNIL
jgi:hypothetical protein